jgi:hypothetical protein
LARAKALLPALILGYLVPTIAMYLPWSDINTTMSYTALWQPSPVFINLLMLVLPFLFAASKTGGPESAKADVKYLQRIYLVSGTVSAIVHVATMLACLLSNDPHVSLRYIFVPNMDRAQSSMAAGVHHIFQVDFILCFASSLAWALLAFLDLKREGKTTTCLAWAITIVTALSIFAGPSAALAITWYWREALMVEGKKEN